MYFKLASARSRRPVSRILLGVLLLLVTAAAHAGSVEGRVDAKLGKLPRDLRIRAHQLHRDLPPVLAPVDRRGRFLLQDLAPGTYRFDFLLPNNTVVAQAGESFLEVEEGKKYRLDVEMPRGVGSAAETPFLDWPLQYKAIAVVGAVAAAAVICEADDCTGDDDSASPSSP
ncbi:hypothetical protein ABI59_23060 [Acidobacteria bacterium Mor1]|nr:hypothetical protein ABI59_23060 [Acidobacteria bacterium Mor1]